MEFHFGGADSRVNVTYYGSNFPVGHEVFNVVINIFTEFPCSKLV